MSAARPGPTTVTAAAYVTPDGRVVPGGGVRFDGDGRVTAAGAVDGPADVHLPGHALLPGFVNAHSHSFQRLLRGRVQSAPAGTGADESFWTWRGLMYDLAGRLDPDDLYVAARFTFAEMLLAGWTSVGEFHYLHHDRDGSAYAEPNELALAVLRAASDVGIRIVLLDVGYERLGAGTAPHPAQRRFLDPDPDAWLARVDALRGHRAVTDDPLVSGVGVAPHSLRAVGRESIAAAVAWADAHTAPIHLHVSEQPAENAAVLAEHGATPVGVLADAGALGPRCTAVHATHLTDDDVRLLGGTASNVCVCPTTERDLGDGVTPAAALVAAGTTIALGSDSHALIDPFEEARATELDERLVRGSRVVHRDAGGRSGPPLFAALTSGGARALGLGIPHAPGAPADAVAVDLSHIALRGWTPGTLVEHLVYAAAPAAVTDVWVQGRRVVNGGRHHAEEAVLSEYDRLAARLLRD